MELDSPCFKTLMVVIEMEFLGYICMVSLATTKQTISLTWDLCTSIPPVHLKKADGQRVCTYVRCLFAIMYVYRWLENLRYALLLGDGMISHLEHQKLTVMLFVRTIQEGDFQLYIEALNKIVHSQENHTWTRHMNRIMWVSRKPGSSDGVWKSMAAFFCIAHCCIHSSRWPCEFFKHESQEHFHKWVSWDVGQNQACWVTCNTLHLRVSVTNSTVQFTCTYMHEEADTSMLLHLEDAMRQA